MWIARTSRIGKTKKFDLSRQCTHPTFMTAHSPVALRDRFRRLVGAGLAAAEAKAATPGWRLELGPAALNGVAAGKAAPAMLRLR